MRTPVIGAAIINVIMEIKRLSRGGEDILCSEAVLAVGGYTCNVTGALWGFDADHDLFVPVERDMYGNMIIDDLEKSGYPTLIRDEGSGSSYCLHLVGKDGERTFVMIKGAEGCFRPSWFEQLSQDAYDSIYVARYQMCDNDGRVISGWMEGAKGRMKKERILFAPGPVVADIDGGVTERILSMKPIPHLDEEEAFDYTRQPSVGGCLRYLHGLNHDLVAVTMEAFGAMYYDGSEIEMVPACKTRVKSTIGAGDSHVAAIVAGYPKGLDTEQHVGLVGRVASGIVSIQGPMMIREMFEQQGFTSYTLNGYVQHTNAEGKFI